jgi:MOSC domain-containing protein YiiM
VTEQRQSAAAGRVEAIWIAETAGAPMRSLDRAQAVAGVGLAGDRYATGTGHWSPMRRSGDVLTLIEAEVVDTLVTGHGIGHGDTRRNVVTRGIRLDDLIGREIRIGTVGCRVIRRCEPCSYLDGLLGANVLGDLVHRGGVRAEILTSGEIAVGDTVGARRPGDS